MTLANQKGNFGIVVSGGPAPGINSVIASAVIEANNSGYQVWGFFGGFKGAISGEETNYRKLTTEEVSRIGASGGSILGTSRFNPLGSEESGSAFKAVLDKLQIDKLIVIGGEGSAYVSYMLGKHFPDLNIVHVPKTIDNDLVLPNHHVSFGFETAREVGAHIVRTLMVDAKTTQRWYFVEAMGRQAGFLALGVGMAAGATLTVIPEEFARKPCTPDDLAEILLGSIKQRLKMGKPYGVAIFAEGILDSLDPEQTDEINDCLKDDLGRITYSEIELGDIVVPHLRQMCKKEGIDVAIKTKNLGYELRCANPVAFDIEYTKFLGYGAVRHILGGHRNVMVTRDYDQLGYLLIDRMAEDGHIRSRTVDLSSDYYKVARSFMIR